MSDRCKQCGAALTERDAFCTKCGAQLGSASEPATQRFCTKCGAPLLGETKFCTKCGAAAGVGSNPAAKNARDFLREAMAGASSSATAKAASQATPAPVAKSAAGIPKVAIIGGAIVVLVILIAAVAGFIHAAHRARESAQEREAAENIEKSLDKSAADSKDSAAKKQAGSSSDADLQKNLADLQAAANALGATSGNPGANGASSNSGAANATPAASAKPSAPYGWTLENGKLVPAKAPEAPPMPKADPIEPVAATSNQAHDWALKYERTPGGPEADLVVRTGDINNLGFGWPQGFDPFSGQSTPPHQWPDINKIPPGAPDGTDRIMLGTSVMPVHMVTQHTAGQADKILVDSIVKMMGGDGYSGSLGDCFSIRNDLPRSIRDNLPPDGRLDQLPNYLQIATVPTELAVRCTRERQLTMPTPIVLPVGALPAKIDSVLFQIFVDDFQAPSLHSHFQVDLNGTRIPTIESAINSIDQSGPIGQLVTVKLLPEYWPLLKSGTVKLLFDDPTTHVPDGYAIDFVRILVNPHNFKYQVSLAVSVVDLDAGHAPVAGATVSAALESATTDKRGKCELKGMPAGLVVATASAPGYDENSVPVALVAGQAGAVEIQLHRHQENTAALEKSIEQTGTATIYGIHFDTGSSKLRPDSLPALNAVLGLINNRAGSRWIISGHTDNQGSDRLNIPLSKARAASVVSWLTAHGIAADRLEPEGFGASRPVADNATANGRALNRRVEVALAK